jgi:hypothetical protein
VQPQLNFFCFHRTTNGWLQTASSAVAGMTTQSTGYEFRTDFAKSRALERIGLRETKEALMQQRAVRSFAEKARRCGRFSGRREPEREFA